MSSDNDRQSTDGTWRTLIVLIVWSMAWGLACVYGVLMWMFAGSDRRLIDPWDLGLAITAGFLLAVIPWVLWLPWRFSLRTLLITMTLVAVGLGVIVVALE